VEFIPVARPHDAFQRPVPADVIAAIWRRAVDPDTEPDRVVELATGTFNNTYRLERAGCDRLILRIAPRGDTELRAEYAVAPALTAMAGLVADTVHADFSGELLDRDYLVQTMLPGHPADESVHAAPIAAQEHFYRELGEIARRVHAISGPAFGDVLGPAFPTWSDAVAASLDELIEETDAAGLEGSALRRVSAAVARHRAILDEIDTPRLLHRDLWVLNLLVVDRPDGTLPITGVVDWGRAAWGDPLADWPIHNALTSTREPVRQFWAGYGSLDDSPGAAVRQHFYQARNLAAARLDIHRRGLDFAEIPPRYWDATPRADALS
jgi:aminoglycoside phosphotransferase (APT) family kinase protein